MNPDVERHPNLEGCAQNVATEIADARDLEKLTGTKASTWRYWAMLGVGPASFKLGRRRVWRMADVLAWIAQQEAQTGTGGVA